MNIEDVKAEISKAISKLSMSVSHMLISSNIGGKFAISIDETALADFIRSLIQDKKPQGFPTPPASGYYVYSAEDGSAAFRDYLSFYNGTHAVGIHPSFIDFDDSEIFIGVGEDGTYQVTINSGGSLNIGSTSVTNGDIDLGSTGTVTINGEVYYPQTVTVCVDGQTKTMKVLGTDPA